MPHTVPRKHRLNERYLRSLRPEPHDYRVYDTLQRGLVVRVRSSGAMTWQCLYRHHGRACWYHIASLNAVGLAQARRLANDVMYKAAAGEDPNAVRRAQRGAGTFAELATRYRGYAERRNKSWRQADALVTRYLLPRWQALPAAAVTRGDVRTLMASITAPILANQILAAASACFSWAMREDFGGVAVNPCVGVERNRTNKRTRVLSDAELPRFWRAFDDTGLINSMVLKMILLTGQRPGEVCAMRTEHIDAGLWTLPGLPVPALKWPGTKNRVTHPVWLPAPALAIIDEMEASGFVFAGATVPALGIAMRAICKALGVNDPVKPHDLRRTHGSTITGLGFGRDAMNRVQNHIEGGMADVYDQHRYADENKQIMEAVAAKIMFSVSSNAAGSNVVTGSFQRI
jgi:integrase